MFWGKRKNEPPVESTNPKPIHSDEYEFISKRIITLETEIKSLKAAVDIIQTGLDNLRGNFNRKLKGIAAAEQAEQKQETENIKEGEPLPFG